MRHQKGLKPPKPEPPSKRRLAAAEKHLRKERERYALFADEVAAEQPTPEKRIEGFDVGFREWSIAQRAVKAAQWKLGRKMLRELSDEDRKFTFVLWQQSRKPGDPIYFIEHVRNCAPKTRERIAAGERWFVFQVADEFRIVLWDPKHVPKHGIGPPMRISSTPIAWPSH